jgi:hypothetical protein
MTSTPHIVIIVAASRLLWYYSGFFKYILNVFIYLLNISCIKKMKSKIKKSLLVKKKKKKKKKK